MREKIIITLEKDGPSLPDEEVYIIELLDEVCARIETNTYLKAKWEKRR